MTLPPLNLDAPLWSANQPLGALGLEVESLHILEESALQSLGEGLVLFDRHEHLAFINAQAQALFDVPLEALLGLSSHAFWQHPGLGLANAAQLLQWFATASTATDQQTAKPFIAYRPTPAPVNQCQALEVLVFPVYDLQQQRLGYSVVLREPGGEQDQLRRKSEMLSLVSHELRGQMTTILSLTNLLLNRSVSPEKQLTMITTVAREARRLAGLVNEWLDWQRLEVGGAPLQLQLLDVAEVTRKIFREVQAMSDHHTLQLVLPPHPPLVRGHAERLHQVLHNLLNNALKYSPAGGTVQVAVAVSATEVEVTVMDQGLGLPPEALSALFERYYRVPQPDRQQIDGTGLGLFIVREIIRQHGGRVWATSPGPGLGSTFGFALPIALNGSANAAPPHPVRELAAMASAIPSS